MSDITPENVARHVRKLRSQIGDDVSEVYLAEALHRTSADMLEAQAAENAKLREANGILEDALQEVGDDYPGSSCQEWCRNMVASARAALNGDTK